jgi:hypothetical protein
MDEKCGPSAAYVKDNELRLYERACECEAFVIFDDIATMGAEVSIQIKRCLSSILLTVVVKQHGNFIF